MRKDKKTFVYIGVFIIFIFIIGIGTIVNLNLTNYDFNHNDNNLLAVVKTMDIEDKCECSKKLFGGVDCSKCPNNDEIISLYKNQCSNISGVLKETITYKCYHEKHEDRIIESKKSAFEACNPVGYASGKYIVNYSAQCEIREAIFDGNGGNFNFASNTIKLICSNSSYGSCETNFPVPNYANYKLAGWSYSKEDCKNSKYEFDATTTKTKVDDSKTIYACWRPNSSGVEPPYTLTATFNANGGKLSATDDICTPEKNKDSCKVTFPKVTTPPSGKKLSGWSLDSCNTIRWKATETSGVILDHITITACWSNISSSTAPKIDIPVKEIGQTNIGAIRYVNGSSSEAYASGAVGNCGDKVYVTTCDESSSDIATCNITSINGANVTSKVYKKYIVEKVPTCPIIRYAKAGTIYYDSKEDLANKSNQKKLACNTKIEFLNHPTEVCVFGDIVPGTEVNQFCATVYNDNNINKVRYVDRTTISGEEVVCMPEETGGITGDNTGENIEIKPTCTASSPLKNQTSYAAQKMSVCYDYDGKGSFKVNGNDEREIFKCASGYRRVIKPDPVNDTCKYLTNSSGTQPCYRTFIYTCNSIDRPKVHGTGSLVTPENVGTISIKGTDSSTNTGLKGYIINLGESVTHDSKWEAFENSEYIASVQKHAGTHFAWVMTNDRSISYPIMLRIHSDDISTTAEITAKGPNDDLTHTLKPLETEDGLAYLDGITSQGYVRLSNQLMNDSLIATGFDLFKTAYELTVESDKIALYATLTSSDSKYVEGYEPRTIDLDYGRNVAIIKIENSKGAQRSYTFIINRTDTRESVNVLKDVTLSVGKIEFDPYISDYTVSIPKNTKSVNISGVLESDKSAFIAGYEPRAITINEDITSAVLKTISEAGITRNYVFTFIKTGAEEELSISDSAYLSFLSIPGTEIYFDKENLSYSVSVEYATESVPVYALPESDNAIVEINGNIGLKVGANKIEIVVTNGSITKIYNVFINRKEDGLGVSSNTKLETLTVKDYGINFSPDVEDYILKIKREKTLLLTATPASNRSEVYMYGNNDLTAFSTVRVKVIAENGDTGLYSVDIIKDVYNKQLETTIAIVGSIIILGCGIILMVNKKRKKLQDYIEE